MKGVEGSASISANRSGLTNCFKLFLAIAPALLYDSSATPFRGLSEALPASPLRPHNNAARGAKMRSDDGDGRASAVGRRALLKWSAGAAATLLPLPALARTAPGEHERTLKLYNLHTGERIKATYWAEGNYLPEAHKEIDLILRDHYTDEVTDIDAGLLDLLYRIQTRIAAAQGLDVVCGYRSPETNAELVREGRVHARNSYHISGQAIDFRVPGRDLRHVRKLAMSLRGGGVGYYPRAHFIHVDVGPVRHW